MAFNELDRRRFLKWGAVCSLGSQVPLLSASEAVASKPILKTIPVSGESLAVIGMGTSRTFARPDDAAFQAQLLEVLRLFFDNGGQLLDSSPMYGPAEAITGRLLAQLRTQNSASTESLFAATKVWTTGEQAGIQQMQESIQKMAVPVMDLMQIHNLKDWRVHLKTLRRWKDEGKIRYLGITTSHGRFHSELLDIMRTEPLDFVQFSYNIADREAENRLLPMAADKGIATLINRPYQRGELFSQVKGHELPALAKELGCESWGQVFLKWILGHPAASNVIPASSKPKHTLDNMRAGFGRLPDEQERKGLLKAYQAIA